jgi:hypothetical protein
MYVRGSLFIIFVFLLLFVVSNQRRLLIPSIKLDGHKVIKCSDPVVYVLVEDMGGHGRPLVALQESLAMIPNLENFDVDRLLGLIVDNMAMAYPDVRVRARDLVPAVLHVFMRKKVSCTEKLAPGDYTAEDVVGMGLFEYDQDSSTLNCPFVLLCLLSQWSNDQTLGHLDLPSYNRLKQNNTELPYTGQFWQEWEELLGQNRVLKSKVHGPGPVKFSDLHAGAMLGADGDVLVKEERATGIIRAPHIVENDEGTIL